MDELIYRSARELAKAIGEREVSALEVTRAHLERIEAVNPKLNAVVQLAADTALDQARRADTALARGERCGPLHGVPMTIKDAFETAGIVTTAGTKGLQNHLPDTDATVAARAKAAGPILLGKTNTPEITLRFTTDNYVYRRTNNPFDLDRTPGGSSGGAAAILAAGGVAFDICSDPGGSIRIPAHCCGNAGLKPTAGRVPRTGLIPFLELGAVEAYTQIGPLARCVADLSLILDVLAGGLAGPDGGAGACRRSAGGGAGRAPRRRLHRKRHHAAYTGGRGHRPQRRRRAGRCRGQAGR